MPREFTVTEAQEFTRVPDGEYEVVISNVSDITTNSNGKELFTLDYVIADGEHMNKKLRFDNFYITEKSMWVISNLARALGKGIGERLNLDEFHANLLGKYLTVSVKTIKNPTSGKEYYDYSGYKGTSLLPSQQVIDIPTFGGGSTLDSGPTLDITSDDLPF